MHFDVLANEIVGCIGLRDMQALKNLLQKSDEMEILQAFHHLSPEDQVVVFRLLSKDVALSVFEGLDTDQQQNLLGTFSDERTIKYMNELPPDDRVRLLDELPAMVAKRLISSLDPEERESTNILLGYQPETAGRVMTTEFISLRGDMTAEQALIKARSLAADKETIYTLYVTNNQKKLKGVLSLRGLLTAENDTLIEDIMSKNVVSVSTSTDQEEVARTLKELDLLAIPVVDAEDRLVGIVTIDDAIDILEEEMTEDLLIQSGLASVAGKESNRSELLIRGSLWSILKVRLPFLLIILGAGFAAAMLVEGFEEILEAVVAIAFFLPLIMDMGGSVGTQSSTTFARGVALGHIQVKDFFKHFMKELGVGLNLGLAAGLMSGGLIALGSFWFDYPITLALAVGLTLVVTMTLAASLGFLVPYVLIKLNVDQAAGSAPIITSIKDIAGILIYFAFASLFLSHLLY
ncbi:MAG: magnesium transporter [Coriobacteriia bacterium]|nr:magnesium transporter [Coriobacteriia bacterium]MCL2870020.1 magnesium transporter [Coriobacteriia bacterium]